MSTNSDPTPRKVRKNSKKVKEEVPSFLAKMTSAPEALVLPKKQSFNDHYVGMLFFGDTLQKHPSPHKTDLKETHPVQHKPPVMEFALENIFLTPEELELRKKKKVSQTKTFCPLKRPKPCRPYIDPYPHGCPGVLKVFVPDLCKPDLDLGETSSVIVGEACREIPILRSRRSPSGTFIGEMEVLMMSDLWEKKRLLLSPEERMAHAHFFKKFGTVRVIGPKIPASITITELPTKRKRLSDLNFFPESKPKVSSGFVLQESEKSDLTEKEETTTDEEERESEEEEEEDNDTNSENVDVYPTIRPPRNTFVSTESSCMVEKKKWELSFRELKAGMEKEGIRFDDDDSEIVNV